MSQTPQIKYDKIEAAEYIDSQLNAMKSIAEYDTITVPGALLGGTTGATPHVTILEAEVPGLTTNLFMTFHMKPNESFDAFKTKINTQIEDANEAIKKELKNAKQ